MNWAGYIDYWDKFIQRWIDDPIALAQSDPLICNKVDIDNVIDLPEPYYCGVPIESELDAVIINLNPGKSSENEWVKYHCFLDKPDAFISYELARGRSYYNDVNQRFNPLINTTLSAVPGNKWWENNRLKWLDDFYPFGGRNTSNGYGPNKIFVMELSPWHSRSFNARFFKSLGLPLKRYISSFIVNPMADAISRSRLIGGASKKPFGLCFCKAVYDILTNHFSFKTINQWDSTTPSLATGWPRKNNKATDRTYALIEGYSPEGQSCRLLCLWYGNVGVSAPSKAFQIVEQKIKMTL